MASLYDTDFTAWAEQTAKLLSEGRFAANDMPAFIEEIHGLARSDRKAIYSQLTRLHFHLLKLAYFSERHYQRVGAGWKRTVVSARHDMEASIRDSPSLAHYPATRLTEAYDKVRREANVLPHFPDDAAPENCPWSIAQVHEPGFFSHRENRSRLTPKRVNGSFDALRATISHWPFRREHGVSSERENRFSRILRGRLLAGVALEV